MSRDNNKLRTTVYRKPTHIDRLLDQCSYHPTCHKATAVRTLRRRAHLVCDAPNSLSSETKHLHDVFHKNNYNQDFVSRNYYRPTTVTMATVLWKPPPKPSHESYNHPRYPRSSQTDNDLTISTNQRQGQSETKGQIGSGIQYQMLRLPRNLRWRDGQKPEYTPHEQR